MAYEPQTDNITANIPTVKVESKVVKKKKKPQCKHTKTETLKSDSFCTITRCLRCKKIVATPKSGFIVSTAKFFNKEAQQKHIEEALAAFIPPKKQRKAKKVVAPKTEETPK